MDHAEASKINEMFFAKAIFTDPTSPLTALAYMSQRFIWEIISIPVIISSWIISIPLLLISIVTFGLLAIPLNLIWQFWYFSLKGTSWLWFNSKIARPILFFPGVILACCAQIYTVLIPDLRGNFNKACRLTACSSWPHSYTYFKVYENSGIKSYYLTKSEIEVHVTEWTSRVNSHFDGDKTDIAMFSTPTGVMPLEPFNVFGELKELSYGSPYMSYYIFLTWENISERIDKALSNDQYVDKDLFDSSEFEEFA